MGVLSGSIDCFDGLGAPTLLGRRGGGTVELPAGWPDGYRGGPQTMQCLGRLACSAEVPCLPARFAVRGRPMLKSRLGPPISDTPLGFSRG